MEIEKLQYPIGKYFSPDKIDSSLIEKWIQIIESFPARLSETVSGLSEAQLGWLYRPDGWSIRQVVHHCADSHMNSLVRFKLALTEDTPSIKPYFESKWANMPDANTADISDSLKIIEGLHARWVVLLKSMSSINLKQQFYHPEYDATFTLDEVIGMYAWHSDHHLAHIKLAIEQKGQVK